jgi:hypothetical protein
MTAKITLALMLVLSLIACGNQTAEMGPGGVSAEDAKALDQAADKLDNEQAGEPLNQ